MVIKSQKPLPAPGQLWICVTERGRGIPVRIKKVTPNNVQFKAIGAKDENTHSLNLGAFVNRYSLLSDDDAIVQKQRDLRIDAKRNGSAAEQALQTMTGDPIEDGLILDAPVAASLHEIRKHTTKQRARRRQIADLTTEEKEEIREFKRQGSTYQELCVAYNLSMDTLADIVRGITKSGPKPAPAPTPEPTLQPATQEEPMPTNNIVVYDNAKLLQDCSDALKTLVEYREKQSRFVTLDVQAIYDLAEEAARAARNIAK